MEKGIVKKVTMKKEMHLNVGFRTLTESFRILLSSQKLATGFVT